MVAITMKKTDLVSITEAAEYLGISRSAVWIAIQEGRLAASKIGKFYVIRRAEVEKYPVDTAMKKAGDTRKKGRGKAKNKG